MCSACSAEPPLPLGILPRPIENHLTPFGDTFVDSMVKTGGQRTRKRKAEHKAKVEAAAALPLPAPPLPPPPPPPPQWQLLRWYLPLPPRPGESFQGQLPQDLRGN
jgi:hypothetical protein